MDIYCTKCGEPWEVDALHDIVSEGKARDFKSARKLFAREGCEAFDSSHGDADVSVRGLKASDATAALFELLGDDIDGVAAELEDWGF